MVWPMRHLAQLSVCLAAAALLSCGGDDLVLPTDGEPARINITGDTLTGRVGEQLETPLVAQVLDRGDQPVPNATVVIEIPGASADPDTAVTDEPGHDHQRAHCGLSGWRDGGVVRVIRPEGPAEVSAGFTLLALAATADGLAMVSGDGQEGAAGSTLGDPLVVRVTDEFGNPIPDVPITWTAEGGGSVSETSTATDAAGSEFGAAHAGSHVRAADDPGELGGTIPPWPARRWSSPIRSRPGIPSGVRIVSGNEQIGSPGSTLPQPLVVEVIDGSANPVVGAAVTWVVTGGGGSLNPPTGTTDDAGRASTTWTLGSAIGANAAQAIVSGVGEAAFTATSAAGDPEDIRIVSGDGQDGQAGTRLADPLVAQVIDAAGNPVPG